ncbi:hypothetical protein DL98DRAFT_517945 [Cadophora sp. DSE1049]|nr:hypothetical protein DL98DRAFT_517945 [Cadophora sp. DSE1049]
MDWAPFCLLQFSCCLGRGTFAHRSRPANKPAKCSAAVYAQSPMNDRRGTRLFGLQGAVWIRPSAGTPGTARERR